MAMEAQDVVEFVQREVERRVSEQLRFARDQPWTVAKKWLLGGGVVSVLVYSVGLFMWCSSTIDARVNEVVRTKAREIASEAAAPAWKLAAEQVDLNLSASFKVQAAVKSAEQSRSSAELSAAEAARSAAAAPAEVESRLKRIASDAATPGNPLFAAISDVYGKRLATLEASVASLNQSVKTKSLSIVDDSGTIVGFFGPDENGRASFRLHDIHGKLRFAASTGVDEHCAVTLYRPDGLQSIGMIDWSLKDKSPSGELRRYKDGKRDHSWP